MHVNNPEWQIVYTFSTRSLYSQVKYYITMFVRNLSRGELDEPDWNNVKILHGWGGRDQAGLYSEVCKSVNHRRLTFSDAKSYFGTRSGYSAFNFCCHELLDLDGFTLELPHLFDAILIDEAQDFGEHYFRLCYRVLREPKRLIWGYDEVQSLEDLEIPTSESLFGRNPDGSLVVDLDGLYPGDIEKDMILYHCYRNPRPVLIAAHSFGLGLKREGGAVQFIDTVGGWRDIGYEVEGLQDNQNKLEKGQQITLYRPRSNSPHLLEELVGYQNLLNYRLFDSWQDEMSWIAADIARNIHEEELKPEEILVIGLDTIKFKEKSSFLSEKLDGYQIQSFRPGVDTSPNIFRAKDKISITTVYRAKGNESSLVYVYGFEEVGGDHDLIKRRNRAFTAMTRTRGWLTLTGVGDVAKRLFYEISASLEEVARIHFIVPDTERIQRNLETYEAQRRRKRLQKAQKNINELLMDRSDLNPDDIPPEMRKKLIEWLSGQSKRNDEQDDDF
jgi:superfamily I DNA and RNA helicase